MDARARLERLCKRYGVPPQLGARLLPLVERADGAPAPVRRRLMAVVRAALARDAEETVSQQALEASLDQQVLLAVASVLHGWEL